MKTAEQMEVVHSCGHPAVYLLLLDPSLRAEVAAEIGSRPCLLCHKRAKGYGRWGWLRKRSARSPSHAR